MGRRKNQTKKQPSKQKKKRKVWIKKRTEIENERKKKIKQARENRKLESNSHLCQFKYHVAKKDGLVVSFTLRMLYLL